ncbi:MAG: hypothetical protein U0904_11735, partial [Candidatus Nanopelagicales bacterium]|nr:hypothetical protein [Candidatus Nanopelagicales bacterium]
MPDRNAHSLAAKNAHLLSKPGMKHGHRRPKAPAVAIGVLAVIALVLAACTSSPASPAPDLPPAESPEVIVPPPP